MQLQIQTFRPNLKNPSQQSHAQLPPIQNLFPRPRVVVPSQSLLSQLRQIQLTSKAHYHYLTNLRKKAFRCLYEEDYEGQISLMEKGFLAFKQSKVQNKTVKFIFGKFILKLKENCHQNKDQKQQIHQAKIFYEQGLQRRVFKEVFFMIRLNKKSHILDQYLKIQKSAQLIQFLKEVSRQSKNLRLKNEETEEQVNKIYHKQIYHKVFTSWQIFCKSTKLQKHLMYKALQKFIHKLIEDKKETLTKIQTFKQNQQVKKKKMIFQSMKESKLQSQCRDWYKYRLQKSCYLKWVEFHLLAQQQKEIEESNEIILQHFLQKKDSQTKIQLQAKFFKLWKSSTQLEKEQKRQNLLMKSFAELKQKEYLERKYFQILKQNKNYQKAIRFSHKRIKSKVLESLKKHLIVQSFKLENMLKFVQSRTVGKYFNRIQAFNRQQRYKVKKILLKKAWLNFTFKLASQYYEKISKAQNYHKIALQFKAIFTLKKNVQIQRKAEYCAFYFNLSLPLKRWNQRFRFRRFIYDKELYLMKRIMFEWRIASIRKLLTKEELATSELGVESRVGSRKGIAKQKHMVEQKHTEKQSSSVVSEQISFFKKMDQDSDEEEDQMTKRVDGLLTRIKTKREENKKELTQLQRASGSSNERLMLGKESLLSGKGGEQTYEKLRLPTWSSPGNEYRVSVFSEDSED